MPATAAMVSSTCRPPPITNCRLERMMSSMENSRPMVNSSSTTPISASRSTTVVSVMTADAVGAEDDAGDQEPDQGGQPELVEEEGDRERYGEQDDQFAQDRYLMGLHGAIIAYLRGSEEMKGP